MNSGLLANQKYVQFIREDNIGDKWIEFSRTAFPSYREWYEYLNRSHWLSEEQSKHAVAIYMPEIVGLFEQMQNLLNLSGVDASVLSFYCPPVPTFGCSQAVWLKQFPVLVRNYDYTPHLSEGRFLFSNWHGTKVIAATDCLWGVLDGMNEYGLSASVTLVGTAKQAEGFSASVVLRYILEFCRTADEAVSVLKRIPLCTAYNFTFVDGQFRVKTVEVNPLLGVNISVSPVATNHQGDPDVFSYPSLHNSFQRKKFLLESLYSPLSTVDSFINSFAYYPIYNPDIYSGYGTLYTSIYNSSLKAMEFRWPNGAQIFQSFYDFQETEFVVSY